MNELENIRKRIDELDEQLVQLLNERLQLSLDVAKTKQDKGINLFAPDREAAIFKRISGLNNGPLTEAQLKAIYKEIISASIALQGGIHIAYLGPPGSNSHEAATNYFGGSASYMACESFGAAIAAVEKGKATHAILPSENSKEGVVAEVKDLLTNTKLKICSEYYHKVSHQLIGKGELGNVTSVHSHPQALAQVSHWLNANLPNASRISTPSTSGAVSSIAASEKPGIAAVGTSLAAELYGVEVLAENIQDQADNTTRFLVLTDNPAKATGSDKSSLYFGLKHEVGALNSVLSILHEKNINMLKIESRPSKVKQWEYSFFVDIEGHADTEKISAALAEIEKHCVFLNILGSYPQLQA